MQDVQGKHLEALHDVNLRAAKRGCRRGAELKSSTDVLYLDRACGLQPGPLKGSDCPHLVTPRLNGPPWPHGGPAAVKTRLGWTLQGPVKSLQQYSHQQQCLFLATTSQAAELFKQVEKLWQLDTLPYRSERLVTRSRRDQEATNLLEAKTTRVEVEGVLRSPPRCCG
ncbi:hypothetical protein AAFF_G00187840 [Aldrovandia affinis]|uniref:Uncharacterized protein n=1 Tax=Aldrovandia affinis TaxID=143900 RepID=A0AAD7SZ74_9TELE|nr:hypothetical protein AAFF_G00187840 [Aldrovandia affinis]